MIQCVICVHIHINLFGVYQKAHLIQNQLWKSLGFHLPVKLRLFGHIFFLLILINLIHNITIHIFIYYKHDILNA